jgi:hypothetical protein
LSGEVVVIVTRVVVQLPGSGDDARTIEADRMVVRHHRVAVLHFHFHPDVVEGCGAVAAGATMSVFLKVGRVETSAGLWLWMQEGADLCHILHRIHL